MAHRMFRGMDAIDYEPPAGLFDDFDSDQEYYVERSSDDELDDSEDNKDNEDNDLNSSDEGNYHSYQTVLVRPVDFGPEYDVYSKIAAHDFRNPKFFPTIANCSPKEVYDEEGCRPPHHHWCLLAEIVNDISSRVRMRAQFTIADKDDQVCRMSFDFPDFDYKSVKVGSTVAVMYAEQRHFLLHDEVFFDLQHEKFLKIFPCNLATLLRINDEIESETPTDCAQRCKACGKEYHNKIILLRCSRCFAASYCDKACVWKDWQLPTVPKPYNIQPEWKTVEPATVREIQGTFSVTSGELLWGDLPGVLEGLVTKVHNLPPPVEIFSHRVAAKIGTWKIARVSGDGLSAKNSWIAYHSGGYTNSDTVHITLCDYVSLFVYPGETTTHPDWEGVASIADHVTGVATLPGSVSLFVHPDHSAYESPLEFLLLSRMIAGWGSRGNKDPRVSWQYDWHCQGQQYDSIALAFASLDPNSGWTAAIEREKRRSIMHKDCLPGNPDYERWESLRNLSGWSCSNLFLVDAVNGPELGKLAARKSDLDTRIAAKQSSSFFASAASNESFGCNLILGHKGGDHQIARLIYGEDQSSTFPGEKEIVAFWYDSDGYYYERDGDKLKTPVFEDL
ncbi:hypothetical protein C8J56DRAFT_1165164 [Mycena floridula]|nr:hypothetical protein C8J56DRAFT_1165164 [Mycena floridula]